MASHAIYPDVWPERHQPLGPAKTMLGAAAALSLLLPPHWLAHKVRSTMPPRLPRRGAMTPPAS